LSTIDGAAPIVVGMADEEAAYTFSPDRGETAQSVIRRLVEDWAIFRDAGDWESFERVWHDDGWMTATWFQGPSAEFIRVSREGFEQGVEIAHFLGGHSAQVRGDRAIAQTKMKIEQRARLDGVEVDVTCSGRFYDFLALRDDRWGIVRRQPIYERDRLDVVDPDIHVALDHEVLHKYPSGYRHLAYIQQAIGYNVMVDLPGHSGAPLQKLYDEGREWLLGSALPGLDYMKMSQLS